MLELRREHLSKWTCQQSTPFSTIVLQSRITGKTETLDFENLERNQLFLDELKHFLAAVNGEVSPVVNLRSGYESLQMALAARTSIETGEVQILK